VRCKQLEIPAYHAKLSLPKLQRCERILGGCHIGRCHVTCLDRPAAGAAVAAAKVAVPRAARSDRSALARCERQNRRAAARQRQGLRTHRACFGAQARYRGDPGAGRRRNRCIRRRAESQSRLALADMRLDVGAKAFRRLRAGVNCECDRGAGPPQNLALVPAINVSAKIARRSWIRRRCAQRSTARRDW
jgi:hypothetical protein